MKEVKTYLVKVFYSGEKHFLVDARTPEAAEAAINLYEDEPVFVDENVEDMYAELSADEDDSTIQ